MYRKFTADHIFNGYEILPPHKVLITDADGRVVDIVDREAAGDDVEMYNGLLSPGFINCHCHLELSHLLGCIPERTGLVDFVVKVVNERHFNEAEILEAIVKGEEEMLGNGIVAVGDICNNTFTLSQKKKGRLHYHNFIEASGFPPAVATVRFERATLFYEMYKKISASSVVPHAAYSVSPGLFQLINDLPGNGLLTIHNQETAAEDELFLNRTGDLLRMFEKMNIDISFFKPSGKSSLQTWMPHFNNQQSLILVHNVATSAADIEFAKLLTANRQLQTFFCLCPNANLYISNLLPAVDLFREQYCDIVLGTDSLASNHQLDILAEIKTLQKHFSHLPLVTMLQWATSNGARALQMNDTLGSFEKGKQPGVVLIEKMDGQNLTVTSKAKRIL